MQKITHGYEAVKDKYSIYIPNFYAKISEELKLQSHNSPSDLILKYLLINHSIFKRS